MCHHAIPPTRRTIIPDAFRKSGHQFCQDLARCERALCRGDRIQRIEPGVVHRNRIGQHDESSNRDRDADGAQRDPETPSFSSGIMRYGSIRLSRHQLIPPRDHDHLGGLSDDDDPGGRHSDHGDDEENPSPHRNRGEEMRRIRKRATSRYGA